MALYGDLIWCGVVRDPLICVFVFDCVCIDVFVYGVVRDPLIYSLRLFC